MGGRRANVSCGSPGRSMPRSEKGTDQWRREYRTSNDPDTVAWHSFGVRHLDRLTISHLYGTLIRTAMQHADHESLPIIEPTSTRGAHACGRGCSRPGAMTWALLARANFRATIHLAKRMHRPTPPLSAALLGCRASSWARLTCFRRCCRFRPRRCDEKSRPGHFRSH